MPSIPQSLLWISLVVLWLFVLVPMLISKRDAVRRTSDVALATRVLNSAAGARLLRRTGPAAGHRSDPDWQPQESSDLDDLEDEDDLPQTQPVAQADLESTDADDEDSAAHPIESAAEEAEAELVAEEQTAAAEMGEAEAEPNDPDEVDEDPDEDAAQYEYVDDTSGIEIAAEPSPAPTPVTARRRRYESKTSAAVSARKYRFRKRMVMTLSLCMLATALVAYLVTPTAWWACGGAGSVTVLYLAYLRRQTRIEQRLRLRRMQRVARSRLGVENAYDREFDVIPARLRRPGAVVLEIDDEDPIFEHLDYASLARHYDLPRAAGQ
ncbi:MAG TPA: gephyrin-like molybdotransferase receptor GlpR [Mycobacterium sp.]|uniref:divisome protein SepX/GlpR n=1 Tax=Mycobacterium sp. TaxID=1785 RepID=UPI002D5CC52E|nr:gephyrin-like molybdotransferase receptor GlpR [Mycobacterium sp.]HZU46713.1 gephyrin-like molybdotransferase receptor GlpR [Mycobacterium sp.]